MLRVVSHVNTVVFYRRPSGGAAKADRWAALNPKSSCRTVKRKDCTANSADVDARSSLVSVQGAYSSPKSVVNRTYESKRDSLHKNRVKRLRREAKQRSRLIVDASIPTRR